MGCDCQKRLKDEELRRQDERFKLLEVVDLRAVAVEYFDKAERLGLWRDVAHAV
jgi:hypothetical protein